MSYPCVSCLRGLLFPTLAGWLVASTAFGQEPRLDLYGDPLPAGASARLGTLRFRHGGAVNSVGFLADGKTVVSGSDSGVYLWEAATGKELRMLPGFRAVVSPDGKTIATLDVNERQVHGRIHIIDAATLQTVRQLERGVTTLTLAFSPDGKTLAAGGHRVRNQNQVWLWELATGNELPSPALGRRYDSVYRLAFSPDGKTLATSGNRDDALRFWDLAEGTEQTPLGHNGQALAYAPDGKLLAVEGPDPADARNINSVVKLFDVESLKEVRLLSGLRGGIGAITFTPDAATVIAGDREGQLLLWDTATGKQRVALTAHRDGITALAVSLDGKRLVSGSRDRTLCVWDLATRQPLQTPVGHLGPITAVALSSDGKTAVTASADRSVLVWDLPACQEARRLPHSATVRAGVLSPDGKLLATKSWSDSGNEAHAHLWDLTAGKELRRLPEHYDWSRALAFSPDGRLLARGNNLAVELFDIAADRPLRRAAVSAAQADRTTVPFVAFAPDGKRFAWSNSALGQMTETATGNALGQFAFPRSPTLNDEAHWAA
ncbi:MAG: hypothetical protein JNM56_10875, partial [Planctomycetia bacterium]|nr:hypothetical protein [Planctomycetia bacterium]